jgi:hypothetical protein
MLKKKLLTVACALGILSFGACFGPIERSPIVRPLADARTILVTVTNASQSHHLDPSAFANAIVVQTNGRFHGGISSGNIQALTEAPPGVADATLKVTILSESARQYREFLSSESSWKISIKVSATLVGWDGRVIWSDGDVALSDHYPAESGSSSFNWKPLNENRVGMLVFAYQFQQRMLYIRP